MTITYLDYNATTPIHPSVRDMMMRVMDAPHNASAIHTTGRDGRNLVEQARRDVATLLNCPPAQVIFNSGATEGNNTVLNHFKNDRVLVGATEHVSVLDVLPHAERIPVLSNGLIDIDAFEFLLKAKQTALVSIMMVNNESGVIQDISALSKLTHDHGALFHCDAVQAAGRVPIDMHSLGADFVTVSAHKIGGPQGVGALAFGLCGVTPTLLIGGGQEKSARAGTENVAGIAGFGEAVTHATRLDLPDFQNDIETFIAEQGGTIYGTSVSRVSNTTFFSFPNLRAESALIALDLDGIAISNGSACSSGSVKPSHVLMAMGCDEDEAVCGLRVSTGWDTTVEDIEIFKLSINKLLTYIS